MAVVFAVRGDSLNAYRSLFDKYGSAFNTVSTEADAGAIGGNRLNLWQSAIGSRYLSFLGRGNLPDVRTFSVLIRCAFGYSGSPGSSVGLFAIGGLATTAPPAHLSVYHSTDGNIRAYLLSEGASLGINNSSVIGSFSPVAGTWYDLVFTFTGDTTSNGFKPYKDAVSGTNATSSQAWASSFDNRKFQSIVIGASNNIKTTGIYVNEFVIWNEVIDPTSVTLTSGTGSLNGASRSAFVSVNSFEGGLWNTLTADKIKISENQIQAGTTVTGTYIASERYTDPGISNVRNETSYLFNASTLTGTLVAPGGGTGSAGTVDLNNIKETIQFVLNGANSVGATPCDLSANLSDRVKKVLKIHPEMVPVQASFYPFVTCYITSKDIKGSDIARNQLSTKRRASIAIDVVGGVFNNNYTTEGEDPADEDINYLMENVELILRSSPDLGGVIKWQEPMDIKYYSSRLDRDTNVRAGILSLKAEVFY